MSFPLTITLEFFIDGGWVDVTRIDDDTHMLGLDGASAVTMTKGQSKFGASNRSPDSITFDYVDNNAILNGENPLSQYYGKIGQYTPIRIKIGSDVAAIGELAKADPKWDSTGGRVVVSFTANSLDRRLSQGKKPLNSAMYRDIKAPNNDQYRVAYFPCEEGANATQFVNTENGMFNATVDPLTMRLASYESPGSANLPTLLDGGTVSFPIPSYTSAQSEHKFIALWAIPDDGLVDLTVMQRFWFDGSGTVARADLQYGTSFNGCLLYKMYDSAGTQINSFGALVFGTGLNGRHFLTSTELTDTGADIFRRILGQLIDVNDPQGSTLYSSTIAGQSFGTHITEIEFFPNGDGADVSFGHAALFNDISGGAALGDAIVGFAEETAGRRMERLFDEAGITFSGSGDLDDTALMGPQAREQFMDVIFDAVEADGGILYQKHDALEFVYRTRVSLYNQIPGLELVYAAPTAHISNEFLPRFSDIARRNDVTFTRPKGSSARYVIADDDPLHYTTQDPPTGMGTADVAEDRNVFADSQLNDHAAWWAHLGSWKQTLISPVVIDLHRSVWVADTTKTAQVRALGIGDIAEITTTGAPRWVEYNTVRGLILGYTRTFAQFNDSFEFHTTPADAWEIEVNDS
jgi:hypothetical protein